MKSDVMLSSEMKKFLNKYGIRFSKQKRLTQTFLPKTEYVTHIRNLKFYRDEGLIITNIRKGVIFHQSNWMQEYIQINTSRSKFEKDFFKLLVSLHMFTYCYSLHNFQNPYT